MQRPSHSLTASLDFSALQQLLEYHSTRIITADAKDGMKRRLALSCYEDRLPHQHHVLLDYTLQRAGKGQKLFPLLRMRLQQPHKGEAEILSARSMGQITPAAAASQGVMEVARQLRYGRMADEAVLLRILPPYLQAEARQHMRGEDWPQAGVLRVDLHPDMSEQCTEMFSDNGIHLESLCLSLNLAPAEEIETVDMDLAHGDYRVFSMALMPYQGGGMLLRCNISRTLLGEESRDFLLLLLHLGAPDHAGICPIISLESQAQLTREDIMRLMHNLAQIAACIRINSRPSDALLWPFLTNHARILWQQALRRGLAS